MLAEGGRRVHERIGPLNPKLGRELRPSENPQLSPARRGEIMLCGKVLGQGRQQSIPSLVTHRRRLVHEQRRLDVLWLPPILFEELPERLPAGLLIGRPLQVHRQVGNGHGLIAGHARSSLVGRNSVYTMKIACRGKLPACLQRLGATCRSPPGAGRMTWHPDEAGWRRNS